MNDVNITGPTYLYTLGRHKNEINQVQKRKEIYCTGKKGNKSEKGINQRIF